MLFNEFLGLFSSAESLSLVKTEVLVARTGKGMTQRQILACIVVRVYTNGKEVSVMYRQMNKTGRDVVAANPNSYTHLKMTQG